MDQEDLNSFNRMLFLFRQAGMSFKLIYYESEGTFEVVSMSSAVTENFMTGDRHKLKDALQAAIKKLEPRQKEKIGRDEKKALVKVTIQFPDEKQEWGMANYFNPDKMDLNEIFESLRLAFERGFKKAELIK